jgi:hypothetical protein
MNGMKGMQAFAAKRNDERFVIDRLQESSAQLIADLKTGFQDFTR